MSFLSRLFGRRSPEAPIQELQSLDVVAKRHDGAVDLVIVVMGYLDGSPTTQELLKTKLEYYLECVNNPDFRRDFDDPPAETTHIVIECPSEPAPEISDLVRQLAPHVKRQGACLRLSNRAA